MCACLCAHTRSHDEGEILTKPLPADWHTVSVKSSARVSHVWLQKANRVGNRSWETSPQLTYSGTSSLLFYYFLSWQILLLQFQDNQFMSMRLFLPNWITCINGCVLAPAAGLCSRAGAWQPGSWGRLWLFAYFQSKLWALEWLPPPLHTAISKPTLFLGCRGQILGVFISRGTRVPALSAPSCCPVVSLFTLKIFWIAKRVRAHIHPHLLKATPWTWLTVGVLSGNRKTPPCNVMREIEQGPGSETLVSFIGVQFFPHWEFYLHLIYFLLHNHLWFYQSGFLTV